MGTHPIFESDFDCLTGHKMTVEFYAEGQFDDADSEDEGPLGEEEKQAYLMELINTSYRRNLVELGEMKMRSK